MPEYVDGLPFSQAADNNRDAILAQLKRLLAEADSVVEIGAGTGQHAVHFARHLPHLRWQPTEHPEALATLRPRCEQPPSDNLAPPLALDICDRPWNIDWPAAIYTANTLHIVAERVVESLFAALADAARPKMQLIVYGPFNIGGAFTSQSNARFEEWLKARDPLSGIRDLEWVDALAQGAGFSLQERIAMPANNLLLCWKRD